MSSAPTGERDVIPRWRGYRTTARIGELDPPRGVRPRAWTRRRAGLEGREAEWLEHDSLSFAADLVGSAIVLGPTPEAIGAARRLLSASPASSLLTDAARRLIDLSESERERERLTPEPTDTAAEIRRLRRSTRHSIRNAIRWCELSRFHTIAGHPKKAGRAMQVALGLAPADRYVLRCAARLEIHQGHSDRASALLRKAVAAGEDPWLLAAGLGAAGAAGEPPRLVRRGRLMLESGAFSEHDTSELASALGTLEARGGNDRDARRLFRQALDDPTDNSVAQAEWASRNVGGIEMPQQALDRPESWEARAWSAAAGGEHKQAVSEARQWQIDQPFASRPAEFGSYQASIEADFESGVELIRAALPPNPGEFLLLNNLAFCLASLDQPEEAEKALGQIRTGKLSRGQQATLKATRGLVAYRQGNAERGRALYRESIEAWPDATNRVLALIMLAREEIRIHTPDADQLEAEARVASEEVVKNDDLKAWVRQLDPGRRRAPLAFKLPTRSKVT